MTTQLNQFISKPQLDVLQTGIEGEEGDYFKTLLKDTKDIIDHMPQTYDTSEMDSKDITVHLHYFLGGFDWFVTEKDMEAEQLQAFRYVKMQDNELGYINIKELIANHVELDLHWTPVKLSEVMRK